MLDNLFEECSGSAAGLLVLVGVEEKLFAVSGVGSPDQMGDEFCSLRVDVGGELDGLADFEDFGGFIEEHHWIFVGFNYFSPFVSASNHAPEEFGVSGVKFSCLSLGQGPRLACVCESGTDKCVIKHDSGSHVNLLIAEDGFHGFKFGLSDTFAGVDFCITGARLVDFDLTAKVFELFDIFEGDFVDCD